MLPDLSLNTEEPTDEQVLSKLDDVYMAHLLEIDPKWKLILVWLRKNRDTARQRFQMIDPSKTHEVVRLQEVIRICDHIAERIFLGIKKDGELALIEAHERGLLPEEQTAGT